MLIVATVIKRTREGAPCASYLPDGWGRITESKKLRASEGNRLEFQLRCQLYWFRYFISLLGARTFKCSHERLSQYHFQFVVDCVPVSWHSVFWVSASDSKCYVLKQMKLMKGNLNMFQKFHSIYLVAVTPCSLAEVYRLLGRKHVF
jgi:hypothetical protein